MTVALAEAAVVDGYPPLPRRVQGESFSVGVWCHECEYWIVDLPVVAAGAGNYRLDEDDFMVRLCDRGHVLMACADKLDRPLRWGGLTASKKEETA